MNSTFLNTMPVLPLTLDGECLNEFNKGRML